MKPTSCFWAGPAALLALCCMGLTGCISLSQTEKTKLAELQAQGIRVPEETTKHPGAAGALNILPGFGNFYLAIGTNESEQWIVGFMNLLFWPLSILWGIPEAAIDANTINKRETIYFYEYGPGKEKLKPIRSP
jgi:hypothetical protein